MMMEINEWKEKIVYYCCYAILSGSWPWSAMNDDVRPPLDEYTARAVKDPRRVEHLSVMKADKRLDYIIQPTLKYVLTIPDGLVGQTWEETNKMRNEVKKVLPDLAEVALLNEDNLAKFVYTKIHELCKYCPG